MPRQVVIRMNDRYPFGECEESDNQSMRILVRRSLPITPLNREGFTEKMQYFRRLNHPCIVRIENAL